MPYAQLSVQCRLSETEPEPEQVSAKSLSLPGLIDLYNTVTIRNLYKEILSFHVCKTNC